MNKEELASFLYDWLGNNVGTWSAPKFMSVHVENGDIYCKELAKAIIQRFYHD
jgi:hypothetical protein